MSDSWPYDRPPPAASAPTPTREELVEMVLVEFRRSADLGAITPEELALVEADRAEDRKALQALGKRVCEHLGRAHPRAPTPVEVRALMLAACILTFLPDPGGSVSIMRGWWSVIGTVLRPQMAGA